MSETTRIVISLSEDLAKKLLAPETLAELNAILVKSHLPPVLSIKSVIPEIEEHKTE